MVEQLIRNQQVCGSIPHVGSSNIKGFARISRAYLAKPFFCFSLLLTISNSNRDYFAPNIAFVYHKRSERLQCANDRAAFNHLRAFAENTCIFNN